MATTPTPISLPPPTTSAPPSYPSYWWMHALVMLMYLLMAMASLSRIARRISQSRGAYGSADYEVGAAEILRDLPQRQRHVMFIFVALAVYSVTRAVDEGLIAFAVIPGVGTYLWSTLSTVPAFFFGLVQTSMIARWVHTVEELMYDAQHTPFRVGTITVVSSALFLASFAALTIFSVPDTTYHWTGLSKDDWEELLSFFQGVLFIYNGVCFLVLGLQMVFFWATAAEHTKRTRQRILAIAVVFCFMLVMRGLILCIFSFSLNQANLHAVMDSNWGAPAVLMVEWFCLAVSFFILAPGVSGRPEQSVNPLPNTLVEYNTMQGSIGDRWEASAPPSVAAGPRFTSREIRNTSNLRAQYVNDARRDAFSGRYAGRVSSDTMLLAK